MRSSASWRGPLHAGDEPEREPAWARVPPSPPRSGGEGRGEGGAAYFAASRSVRQVTPAETMYTRELNSPGMTLVPVVFTSSRRA